MQKYEKLKDLLKELVRFDIAGMNLAIRGDKHWQFGVSPVGNVNYAWLQHIYQHRAPNGTAGMVLANGSMSSNPAREGEIHKNLIEADLVDCMVALPGQSFTLFTLEAFAA
jgi:type I restriction-modification system DNA methylase subunit